MPSKPPITDPVLHDLADLISDDRTLTPNATRRLLDKIDQCDRVLREPREAEAARFTDQLRKDLEQTAQILRDLTTVLHPFVGETGQSEGIVEVTMRLIEELVTLRESHTATSEETDTTASEEHTDDRTHTPSAEGPSGRRVDDPTQPAAGPAAPGRGARTARK